MGDLHVFFWGGKFWGSHTGSSGQGKMDHVGVKVPLEGRSAVWDPSNLLGNPSCHLANTAQILVAMNKYQLIQDFVSNRMSTFRCFEIMF